MITWVVPGDSTVAPPVELKLKEQVVKYVINNARGHLMVKIAGIIKRFVELLFIL